MHKSGETREAFEEWAYDEYPEARDTLTSVAPPASLVGKLWRCSDVMPGALCDQLDMERGSSYARAVQQLRAFRFPN